MSSTAAADSDGSAAAVDAQVDCVDAPVASTALCERGPLPVLTEPFLHHESQAVRFWIRTADGTVGASIPVQVLHYRLGAARSGNNALVTYLAHRGRIDAAVRRRLALGAREPVMLREHDLT